MIRVTSEKMRSEIQLQHVVYIPKQLEPGILYVSERYQVAAHLCPCGCNTKIVTPLGLGYWKFTEENNCATLTPSIGNWQIPCQSHYWITDGQIEWSGKWTSKEIESGRKKEQDRLEKIYNNKKKKSKSWKIPSWEQIKNWIYCEVIKRKK